MSKALLVSSEVYDKLFKGESAPSYKSKYLHSAVAISPI